MNHLKFELSGIFSATTYGKNVASPSPCEVSSFGYLTGVGSSLAVATADDIPLIFAVKGTLIGVYAVNQEEAITLAPKTKIGQLLQEASLDPTSLHIYMGPCKTFSHTEVSRELQIKVMEMGYRCAAKSTSGVDYLDLPVLVFAQLRELEIPFENFHFSELDTFENPDLLFSSARGEEQTNLTIATLL